MKKGSKSSKKKSGVGNNMRKFDGKTILYNLTYDVRRMLDDMQDSKKIVEYINIKIKFLQNPPPGNKINWD
jgi:hypothetical protein